MLELQSPVRQTAPRDVGGAEIFDADEAKSVGSPSTIQEWGERFKARRDTQFSEWSSNEHEVGDGSVLVLLPRLPVASDWTAASATAAPVVNACLAKKAHGSPLGRGAEVHLIPFRRRRPKRLFWRLNGRMAGSALVDFVDRLAAVDVPIRLVHSHFFAASIALPHLRARRGIPYVVSEHSSALTSFNPEKEISAQGMKLATSVYRSASFVLPVSQFLAREIRRRGLPGDLTVVPNPVDTDLFVPRLRRSGPRIVTVARLDPVKRLDVLLRAVAEMVSTGSNICLDIIGDGPERTSLLELAHGIGIADRTTFHGWIDRQEVPRFLGDGSVFALSSYTENLPVAMLEALSCGLPVVGPSVGGIPEIVEGAPGALFEPGDSSSLASSLLRWSDPSDRERQAARNIALERYSIAAVGAQLGHVYRSAIK